MSRMKTTTMATMRHGKTGEVVEVYRLASGMCFVDSSREEYAEWIGGTKSARAWIACRLNVLGYEKI